MYYSKCSSFHENTTPLTPTLEPSAQQLTLALSKLIIPNQPDIFSETIIHLHKWVEKVPVEYQPMIKNLFSEIKQPYELLDWPKDNKERVNLEDLILEANKLNLKLSSFISLLNRYEACMAQISDLLNSLRTLTSVSLVSEPLEKVLQAYQDFLKKLSQGTLEEKKDCMTRKLSIYILDMGCHYLKKEAAEAILERTRYSEGRHEMASFGGVHFKFYNLRTAQIDLDAPGIEAMVYIHNQIFYGLGSTPNELVKITIPGEGSFAAIASLTVPGESFATFLKPSKGADIVSTVAAQQPRWSYLNSYHLGAQIFASIDLDFGDARPENFKVENFFGTLEPGTRYGISGYDNDFAFADTIRRRKASTDNSSSEHTTDSCSIFLFCPEVQHEINTQLRTYYQYELPELRLIDFLYQCEIKNTRYKRYLEVGIFKLEELQKLGLPQKWVPSQGGKKGTIAKLYEKHLIKYEYLTSFDKVTYKDLFQKVEPLVYEFYQALLKPWKDHPFLKKLGSWDPASVLQELQDSRRSGDDSLTFEKVFQHQSDQMAVIREQAASKMYERFSLRTQTIEEAQQEFLSLIDYRKRSLEEQKRILKNIFSHFLHIEQFTFKHCQALNTKMLFRIMKHFERLQCIQGQLTLIDCQEVTIEALERLIQRYPQIDLRIGECGQLKKAEWQRLINNSLLQNFSLILNENEIIPIKPLPSFQAIKDEYSQRLLASNNLEIVQFFGELNYLEEGYQDLILQKDVKISFKHFMMHSQFFRPSDAWVKVTIRFFLQNLISQKTDPFIFRNIYRQLPDAFRPLFLDELQEQVKNNPTITAESKLEFYSPLLSRLKWIPNRMGTRPIVQEREAAWEQTLENLVEKVRFEPFSSEDIQKYKQESRVLISWVNLHGIKYGVLHPVIQNQLFDKDGNLNQENKEVDGRRWAKLIYRDLNPNNNNAADPICIKFPEFPGIQLAAERIIRRISGLNSYSTMVICDHPKQKYPYPLLFSKYAGKTLRKYRREGKALHDIEQNFDSYAFTFKVCDSKLTGRSDDKDDNLALEAAPGATPDQPSWQLMSFDCDQDFQENSIQSGIFSDQLEENSLTYLFKGMLNPPDVEALQDLDYLDPYLVLKTALQELQILNELMIGNTTASSPISGLFSKEVIIYYFEQKAERFCFLPVAFIEKTIEKIYRNFRRLQAVNRERSNNTNLTLFTHFSLLHPLDPRLVQIYEHAFLQGQNPEDRFRKLPSNYLEVKDPHTQVIYQKTITGQPHKRALKSITVVKEQKREDLRKAYERGNLCDANYALCYELEPLENYYQQITTIRLSIQKGDFSLFNNIKKSDHYDTDFIKDKIFNALNWNHLQPPEDQTPTELQQQILKAMIGVNFERLILCNLTFISCETLLAILKHSTHLKELDLSGCTQFSQAEWKLLLNTVAYLPLLTKLIICHLPNLNEFYVNNLQIILTSPSFPSLRNFIAEHNINLRACYFTANFLEHLSFEGCSSLTKLGVTSPTRLQFANFKGCLELTEERMVNTLVLCYSLNTLNLKNCHKVCFAGLKQKAPQLARFKLKEYSALIPLITDIVDNKVIELKPDLKSKRDLWVIEVALRYNTSVRELNLEGQNFEDNDIDIIRRILQKPIETLNVARTSLTNSGIINLMAFLKTNTTLKKLDISFNDVSAKGIEAIAQTLKVNQTMTELNITGFDIRDESALLLIKSLKDNRSIIKVSLLRTSLNTQLLDLLDGILKRNQQLLQPTFISLQTAFWRARKDSLLGDYTQSLDTRQVDLTKSKIQ